VQKGVGGGGRGKTPVKRKGGGCKHRLEQSGGEKKKRPPTPTHELREASGHFLERKADVGGLSLPRTAAHEAERKRRSPELRCPTNIKNEVVGGKEKKKKGVRKKMVGTHVEGRPAFLTKGKKDQIKREKGLKKNKPKPSTGTKGSQVNILKSTSWEGRLGRKKKEARKSSVPRKVPCARRGLTKLV